MRIDWSPLRQELSIWRSEARALPIWWRDDDAIDVTPELEVLSRMSQDLGLPVHLAVIPKPAKDTLAQFIGDSPNLIPVVHGWQHINHAPKGSKKAEFGHSRAEAKTDIRAALERMRALFAGGLLPIFVPPWNRIDPALYGPLAALGYVAISSYLPRPQRFAAPGLIQINTHLDPINWRGDRGLADPDALLRTLVALLQNRRSGHGDADEPLGFLTHHLVHDDDIWTFSKACLGELLNGGAAPANLNDLKRKLS